MKRILLILLLVIGCDKEYIEVEPYLDLLEYEIVITETTSYAHVYYEATPGSSIFWISPDTVIINNEKTCIVCCRTYTNKNGKGQQLVILPYNYSIREWTVIGYMNENVKDTIYINEKI